MVKFALSFYGQRAQLHWLAHEFPRIWHFLCVVMVTLVLLMASSIRGPGNKVIGWFYSGLTLCWDKITNLQAAFGNSCSQMKTLCPKQDVISMERVNSSPVSTWMVWVGHWVYLPVSCQEPVQTSLEFSLSLLSCTSFLSVAELPLAGSVFETMV